MAFTRLHTTVERIRLSVRAKKREADKKALRAVAAKTDPTLVNTGQDKPKTGVVITAAKSFANFIRAGFGSKVPIIALPQSTPVQVDEHAVAPVTATPVYPTAEQVANRALYPGDDGGSNLRGLIETHNQPTGGWKTRFKG